MTPRFRIEPDGMVLDAGGMICIPIGSVAALGHTYWIGKDRNGHPLAGPTKVRGLAALSVIRADHWPDATLLDVEEV